MTNTDQIRKRQLAQIHIAKSDLGLDDDTYRALLIDVTGVDSAAKLNATQRRAVLERFFEKGWVNKKQKGRPRTVSPDRAPLIRKIGALLADMKLPWSYADGIAKQMGFADIVQWCAPEQLRKIAAALQYKANRA